MTQFVFTKISGCRNTKCSTSVGPLLTMKLVKFFPLKRLSNWLILIELKWRHFSSSLLGSNYREQRIQESNWSNDQERKHFSHFWSHNLVRKLSNLCLNRREIFQQFIDFKVVRYLHKNFTWKDLHTFNKWLVLK